MVAPNIQTREIANILAAARSPSDAIDLLFRHYKALSSAQDRESFVLALVADEAAAIVVHVDRFRPRRRPRETELENNERDSAHHRSSRDHGER